MIVRILTVREHKTVYFCDVCGNTAYRQQLMIEKAVFPEINIQAGVILDGEFVNGVSRKGDAILVLVKLFQLYGHTLFFPYKSYGETSKNTDTGELHNMYANILNGGKAFGAELLKKEILAYIEQYMKNRGVVREYTPITTAYRGTSVAIPQRAEGRFSGHRFIKITHELGLKIKCYTMLQSVYEIGYVCRDRYENQKNLSEFLSVEGVVLLSVDFSLQSFFYDLWKKVIEIADTIGVAINDRMKKMVLIDFVKEYGNVPLRKDANECQQLYEKLIRDNNQMIIFNAPLDSPFVYSDDDNLPLETKWIFDGKGIGHGYEDEYRLERVYDAFERQQTYLKNNNIDSDMPMDYLDALASSGLPTRSFAVGIDRFINCLLEN